MNVIVVAHHTRLEQVARLREEVNGHLVVDWQSRGALWGHIQALELASRLQGRSIVLEDDALPVEGFMDLTQAWLERFPDDLISFYLGTSRPKRWQPVIKAEIEKPGDHIELNELVHGVCYSIPEGMTERVLKAMPPDMAADFAIGHAWREVANRKVIYPKLSLVEHADGGSVEKHPDGHPRTEPRKAWALAGPIINQNIQDQPE